MQQKRAVNIRTLVLIGVLTAMVFVLSMVSWQIGEISRIHFGNIMCLLAGVLFGPVVGGISAGLGSMLYDFTNPLYTPEFWITFIMKFAMAFLAGWLVRALPAKMPAFFRYLVGALGGSGLYVALYVVKSIIMQHFVYGNPWVAVWPVVGGKAVISGINGLLAVAACVILAPALHAALQRAGFYRKRSGHAAG